MVTNHNVCGYNVETLKHIHFSWAGEGRIGSYSQADTDGDGDGDRDGVGDGHSQSHSHNQVDGDDDGDGKNPAFPGPYFSSYFALFALYQAHILLNETAILSTENIKICNLNPESLV